VKGSEACSECPEHTESPVASISKYACICKDGFEGPNGGPCVEIPWKPPPRSPTLPSDVTIAMSVSMPLAIQDFKEEQATKFRTGLANVAGVDVSAVYITNVEPITTGRRSLMAESIKISTEITFSDLDSATSMSNDMTADKLNAQFEEVGLPAVQILESPVVSSSKENQLMTEEESIDDRALTSSSGPWIIIGTIIGVFVMFVLGTLAFIMRKRCKQRQAFEVPLTDTSPGPNMMPSHASEQRQLLADASIENPGGSLAVHVQEEGRTMFEPPSEENFVGEFVSMAVGPPIEIDRVVMGSDEEDPAATAPTDAGFSVVKANQIVHFTDLLIPGTDYKGKLQETMKNLNMDLATVMSDTGFFRARPMETTSDHLQSVQTYGASRNEDQAQTTLMRMKAAASEQVTSPTESLVSPVSKMNLGKPSSVLKGRELVKQMYASMTTGDGSSDESEHET